jgi:hypothetical protein
MAKSDLDIIEEILRVTSQEGYTPMDRYRDFKKVFGTEDGKRVLREIISWGRLLKTPMMGNPIDPYAMAIAFGERNLASKIMAAIHNEPPDKPQRTRQKT